MSDVTYTTRFIGYREEPITIRGHEFWIGWSAEVVLEEIAGDWDTPSDANIEGVEFFIEDFLVWDQKSEDLRAPRAAKLSHNMLDEIEGNLWSVVEELIL